MRTQLDFDYERARNRLIPHAESVANQKCGTTSKDYNGDVAAWGRNWNHVYLTTMDKMAIETGLFK